MESNLPDRHTKQGNHTGAAVHTCLSAQGTDYCPWQLVMDKAGRARIQLTWLQPFRTKQIMGCIFSLSNQKGGNLRRAETSFQKHHLLVHIQVCLGDEWSQGSREPPDTAVCGNRADTKAVHGAGLLGSTPCPLACQGTSAQHEKQA